MRDYATKFGAEIHVLKNGNPVRSLKLKENQQLRIQAEEYVLLQPGETVELIENAESRTLTVPPGRIILVKWRVIEEKE